jgi:SsrA-binding protein
MSTGAHNEAGRAQEPIVAVNRRALHEYHVLDRIEAGIELRGAEVKAIRDHRCSLTGAYAEIKNNEAFLSGFHVQPYEHARVEDHNPLRPKKLLLHRREIDRLLGQTSAAGMTLIPLKLYFRRGRLKVELGLCRGKQRADKREAIRRRTAEREARRAMAGRMRR